MSKSPKKASGKAAGTTSSRGRNTAGPSAPQRPRLILITPLEETDPAFAASLAEALAGGDVAAVILAPQAVDEARLQTFAEALVPIIQEAGAAAVVANDTRVAGRVKADGVHLPFGHEDLSHALKGVQPNRSVGVGDLKDRDSAMAAAEQGADYVLFGLLDRPETDEAHEKTLDFAEWWAEVFEIPCVALAGRTAASIEDVAETGAEFVAVRAAVWEHPDGPRRGVEEANRLIDAVFLQHQAT